jgi:hypothetical protein
MSKELLTFLNGNKKGKFKSYLENLSDNPSIAWYPSAGSDFRALLYLNPKYSELNPASQEEKLFPEIFIFTDYYPWTTSTFLDSPIIHDDGRTQITVNTIEELPGLYLPVDKEIVDFPEGSIATGKVLFLEVLVKSNLLGDFKYPVIYAFVENEPFCSKVLLLHKSIISHIIHIRYGGGACGGGKSSGIWVQNVLRQLNCKVFVTDGHYSLQSGDMAAYKLYPNLFGKPTQMKITRKIKSEGWSGHGDVSWFMM